MESEPVEDLMLADFSDFVQISDDCFCSEDSYLGDLDEASIRGNEEIDKEIEKNEEIDKEIEKNEKIDKPVEKSDEKSTSSRKFKKRCRDAIRITMAKLMRAQQVYIIIHVLKIKI